MSDNEIPALPQAIVTEADDDGMDGQVLIVTANSATGLATEVIDVRAATPDAFPPRTVPARVVTDQASLLHETDRRPLLAGHSTVWGNRKKGTVTVIYDELPPNTEPHNYTRRGDRLILQFVPDPDWAIMRTAADGRFHGQSEFADLIESAGHLITSHAAADLVECAENIRTSSSGKFESKINRTTGSQAVTYVQDVTVRGGSAQKTSQLELPKTVTFTAAPFEDYPPISVECYLRLNTAGGDLQLGFFPKPYEHLIRAAWDATMLALAEKIGGPIYAANMA
jgi:hypothetical protein